MLRRRDGVNGGSDGGQSPAAFDEDLCNAHPVVHDFLAQLKWEDGSPREPGTVLLFAESGRFKVCLNDRDQQLVAFMTLKAPELVLDELDAALASDGLDWRGKQGTQRPKKSS